MITSSKQGSPEQTQLFRLPDSSQQTPQIRFDNTDNNLLQSEGRNFDQSKFERSASRKKTQIYTEQQQMSANHSSRPLSSQRYSERPSSNNNFTKKSQKITSPNSKFDFVCTSEACFRIKSKLNSTAFGKNSKNQTANNNNNTQNQNEQQIGEQLMKQVSPNMMIKKTKTAKEIKLEMKIKELFDNDPLIAFKTMLQEKERKTLSHSNSIPLMNKTEKMKSAMGSFLLKNISKEANNVKTEMLKVLNDFNIPLHKYNSIQGEDQKQEFVLDHMQTHMKNMIQQLDELQKAKQQNDHQRVAEINKRFENDKGLYAWLQVLTPHTSLHKKLRKALIEKFQSEEIDPYEKEHKMPLGFIGETDYKSHQVLIDSTKALTSGAALQSAIEQTFEEFVESCQFEIEREKITKQKRPTFWQFNKTTAETIKLINAKNVDMLKPMYKDKKKKKRPQTAANRNIGTTNTLNPSQSEPQLLYISFQKLMILYSQQSNNMGSTMKSSMRPQSGILSRADSQPNFQFISPEMKKYMLKKERQAKSKKLNWGDLYEKRFQEHKTEMRIRLADLSSTNSWNQVVLGSFIKLFTKKPKAVEPNLMEEYKNLEYEKVKQIVSSIPSLNECIDKEYFQSIIDKMNKKKIDQVETQISNQVITNYEKEKEKSKVARFTFLKKKADTKGTIIKNHDQDLQKKYQSEKRKQENVQVANRFRVVLKGLDNNFIKLKSQKEHLELERFHNPKKKGLPEPLELPTEHTEAYRNKVIYEYFKDCPNKPKFKHDQQAEYFLSTTAGGPMKGVKKDTGMNQEQVARAALKIQRAVKRWRKRKQIEKERERQAFLEQQEYQKLHSQTSPMSSKHGYLHSHGQKENLVTEQSQRKQSFFVTQSSQNGNQGNPDSTHNKIEQFSILDASHKGSMNIKTGSIGAADRQSKDFRIRKDSQSIFDKVNNIKSP